MATINECIEFALKNIGLWWRYGSRRHCDEWKYIIIGRIFESEIILIPPSLKISESSSNGSYRNTDEVSWRYGISRSCDECPRALVFMPYWIFHFFSPLHFVLEKFRFVSFRFVSFDFVSCRFVSFRWFRFALYRYSLKNSSQSSSG